MKKKYLNIFLSILLVFIWGSIIKKYFFDKPTNNFQQNSVNIIRNAELSSGIIKEDFELMITNNPFKTAKKNRNSNIKNSTRIKRKSIQKKPLKVSKVEFPKIKYYGFVKSENSKSPLVLLSINNKLFRKRAGEKFVDIHIIKTYDDSLIVSFQDNLKTIKK